MFRVLILLCAVHSALGAQLRTVLQDPDYFPLAVWLQHPRNAEKYKAAGINLYVGLHRGPNAEQLELLEKSGMPVVCHQNSFALEQKDNPIIVAWMHGDEPDNAQPLPAGQKGWGPPILPSKIQADYEKLRAADPSRPVFLNLGQGVAWDNYIGRGVRRNKPEDYPEYIKGADIVSFDIYPAVHDHTDIAGKLEFVGRGVERLRKWAGPDRTVWNCIEAARISNVNVKPTPEQIRSEVWLSLIHGSRGIIYFVHQFKPNFIEASLLQDPELLEAVTGINAQIKQLARVLNSPTVPSEFSISSENNLPIATMMKKVGGTNFLFTVAMDNQEAEVTLKSSELSNVTNVEVIDESRTIQVSAGELRDRFKPYQVHLYRFRAAK